MRCVQSKTVRSITGGRSNPVMFDVRPNFLMRICGEEGLMSLLLNWPSLFDSAIRTNKKLISRENNRVINFRIWF